MHLYKGRYESKETLLKLLDHAKKIAVFSQIAIIEEPIRGGSLTT